MAASETPSAGLPAESCSSPNRSWYPLLSILPHYAQPPPKSDRLLGTVSLSRQRPGSSSRRLRRRFRGRDLSLLRYSAASARPPLRHHIQSPFVKVEQGFLFIV